MREAYTKGCTTFEELLDTVVAIDEELLHISAPSRLDYFKSGFEFQNRVLLKRAQLTRGASGAGGSGGGSSGSGGSSTESRGDSTDDETVRDDAWLHG